MKVFKLAAICLLFTGPITGSFAKDNVQVLSEGTVLLQKGAYSQSASVLNTLLKTGYKVPALFCNLGNDYCKTGQQGKAVWCYEQGLALFPFDEELLHNRDLVNARLPVHGADDTGLWGIDKILMLQILDRATFIAAVVTFFVAALYLFSVIKEKRQFKKVCIYLLMVTIPVMMLSVVLLMYPTAGNYGVILKTITAKAGPGQSAKNSFILNEGEKVSIVNDFDGWYKIRNINGAEGWTTTTQCKLITW